MLLSILARVPSSKKLRTLYVSPAAGRKGIGTALLQELETVARQQGVPELWLHSSLTAEPFYLTHGYVSDGKGEHQLRSGRKMV
jgi:GNAT superfamily N-acetyltransferase